MRALLLVVVMMAVVMMTGFSAAASQHAPESYAPQSHTPQSSAHNGPYEISPSQAADTYVIYSLLIPGKLFDSAAREKTSRWAIAKQTVTFSEMNPRIDPRGALKPPPGNEKGFHQAVQDFELLKNMSFTLQPRLHLDRAYELLDAAQVRELREAKSSLAPDSQLQSRYAAYPGVTFFSAVYFSGDQDAALVYRNDWCGVLCNQGEWIYLEKKNGRWQRMSGITVPGA